jgi:glycosyltransferase involved in cell wall biosynthesis
MALSIVIPAYNEETRLPPTLDRIAAFFSSSRFTPYEIVVVDDGSSDATAPVVAAASAANPAIRTLSNPGNRGKGYAVRNGMLESRGEWALISDADLSTPIEEFTTLFTACEANGADIAIGSRALDRSLVGVHQSVFREYSGRIFNIAMRKLTGLQFLDTQCGFKLFRRAAAQQIFRRQQLDGFSFDVEDLYIASKLGYKTVEVPVRWNNVEGTKVGLRQGLRSFSDLLRIRYYDLHGCYNADERQAA